MQRNDNYFYISYIHYTCHILLCSRRTICNHVNYAGIYHFRYKQDDDDVLAPTRRSYTLRQLEYNYDETAQSWVAIDAGVSVILCHTNESATNKKNNFETRSG